MITRENIFHIYNKMKTEISEIPTQQINASKEKSFAPRRPS
jgi:hypothetical protein